MDTEVAKPKRLTCTERYDQGWYPGEALNTVEFNETAGRTTLVTTLRYESQAARDVVLQSPATSGMEMGFTALDALLASTAAA